ncbi:MAG TPA: hypothetical protein VF403_05060 [Kofleriaceae bacterium]
MRSRLIAAVLAITIAGCAHYQPTRRQVGNAIIGAALITILVILGVNQCHNSAASCDDSSPSP